jgi:hypothetical protein
MIQPGLEAGRDIWVIKEKKNKGKKRESEGRKRARGKIRRRGRK